MNETTVKKITAKIADVTTKSVGVHHLVLTLDEELSASVGQYVIFSFDKDGKSLEYKHTVQNEYINKKALEEDVEFKDINDESFLPLLVKDGSVSVSGPYTFSTQERLANFISNFFTKRVIILTLIILFLLSLPVIIYFSKDYIRSLLAPRYTVSEVITMSVMTENQKPMQDFLIQKIREGKNDDATKSALFWITHRFFDNGGNIYEIYDFINAHEEVAFLREAKMIYPEAFASIDAKKVKAYDMYSLIALLGYFEIANKYNYANFAMLGLASNKYAEIASVYKKASEQNTDKNVQENARKAFEQFLSRSRTFSIITDEYLMKKVTRVEDLKNLKNKDLSDDDLLIGLNQFASAQYFYTGMGKSVISTFQPEQIFKFNVAFSRTYVPRLYFFTNYLWAVSNVNAGTANMFTLVTPLNNVIEYAKVNNLALPPRSIERVKYANKNGESGMFSHATVKSLAAAFVPFKNWLIETGWTEKDFK